MRVLTAQHGRRTPEGLYWRDELLADELLAVEAFSTLIADGPTTGVPSQRSGGRPSRIASVSLLNTKTGKLPAWMAPRARMLRSCTPRPATLT
jgi:hypothetical protein